MRAEVTVWHAYSVHASTGRAIEDLYGVVAMPRDELVGCDSLVVLTLAFLLLRCPPISKGVYVVRIVLKNLVVFVFVAFLFLWRK